MPLRRGEFEQFADTSLLGAAYAPEVAPVLTEKVEEKTLDISDLTAKEIDEMVEAGVLTAAQVYQAEKAGKQRKGVLAKYEDEQGTSAQD